MKVPTPKQLDTLRADVVAAFEKLRDAMRAERDADFPSPITDGEWYSLQHIRGALEEAGHNLAHACHVREEMDRARRRAAS